MKFIVKKLDESHPGCTRMYFQEGSDFWNWAFEKKQASTFATPEEAKEKAKGWENGRFKVIKLVPKKVKT